MNRMAAFILMAKNRGASFSGNSSSSSSSSRESQFNLSHHILQTESAVEASRNVSETSAQSVLCSSGRCAEISGQHGSKNEALTSLSHLIKEGTIIILLKLQSEREMEWKWALYTQYTHTCPWNVSDNEKKKHFVSFLGLEERCFMLQTNCCRGVSLEGEETPSQAHNKMRSPVTTDRIHWDVRGNSFRQQMQWFKHKPASANCYLPSCPQKL